MVLCALGAAYYLTCEPAPRVGILWRDGLPPERRAELERRLLLAAPAAAGDRVRYDLLDTRPSNIEALVLERDISDTDGISRTEFMVPPDYEYGSSWMWVAHRLPILRVPGVVTTVVAICALVLVSSVAVMARTRWRQ
jgi:hypothetical protein